MGFHGHRQQQRGPRQLQRRLISQWFRYADEEIKRLCGDFRRVPPKPPRGRRSKDELAVKAAASKDAALVAAKLAAVGFERGRGASIEDVTWACREGDIPSGSRVALLWDVHNKPEGMSPYGAARRVGEIASVFGRVVDRSAYVSRRMLCFLPLFTREYNRAKQLKVVDGELVGEDHSCPLCDFRTSTHVSLIIHFRDKHEEPRTQLLLEMKTASSASRREGARKLLLHGEPKYRAAAKAVLTPKVLLPDGLPVALLNAGFFVRQMHDKPPKAPDIAAWTHICQVANLGVDCVCFVVDSSNYRGAVDFARRLNVRTVLIGIGNRQEIKSRANLSMTWEDVVTGRGRALAEQAAATWAANEAEEGDQKRRRRSPRPYAVEEDDMFFEYYEDLYPSSDLDDLTEDEDSDSDD